MVILKEGQYLAATLQSSTTTAPFDVLVMYKDYNGLTETKSNSHSSISSTDFQTFLATPGLNVFRELLYFIIHNTDSVDNTLTIYLRDGSQDYKLYTALVKAGESFEFFGDTGWSSSSKLSLAAIS
jgi:hypothetical protein